MGEKGAVVNASEHTPAASGSGGGQTFRLERHSWAGGQYDFFLDGDGNAKEPVLVVDSSTRSKKFDLALHLGASTSGTPLLAVAEFPASLSSRDFTFRFALNADPDGARTAHDLSLAPLNLRWDDLAPEDRGSSSTGVAPVYSFPVTLKDGAVARFTWRKRPGGGITMGVGRDMDLFDDAGTLLATWDRRKGLKIGATIVFTEHAEAYGATFTRLALLTGLCILERRRRTSNDLAAVV